MASPFTGSERRIRKRSYPQPLWKGIDIAFLFFALVHALTGAYKVLTDYQQINRFRKILAGASVVISVVAFIYGATSILAFQPPA